MAYTPSCTCSRADAENNIRYLKTGARTTCPDLYVLPRSAVDIDSNFVDALAARKWGFVVVTGENGAGKSVYIQHLESVANHFDYAVCHIETDPIQIKQYGSVSYFTHKTLWGIRLPGGEVLMQKLLTNQAFQKQIHDVVKAHQPDFEYFSPSLTRALLAATDRDPSRASHRDVAISWLRGEDRYLPELRPLDILDKTKSVRQVPAEKMLYLMKDLLSYLGCQGLMVSVDEIEKVGELSNLKGREALSMLRDIVNVLVSEDSLPLKRGAMEGLFICYAISSFFLGYSGLLEVDGVDFKAQAEKLGAPNITIQEVPRLSTLLEHGATIIRVDFDRLDDLVLVAEKIVTHYAKANGKKVSVAPKKLAQDAFEKTNEYVARSNVMSMVSALDKT